MLDGGRLLVLSAVPLGAGVADWIDRAKDYEHDGQHCGLRRSSGHERPTFHWTMKPRVMIPHVPMSSRPARYPRRHRSPAAKASTTGETASQSAVTHAHNAG
ncbi:hypothetical protein ABZU32_35820 [Sphaerisporangium sp. NPDC005288]|uniref:hypothetical protein n=1 Tax=Sphaerisporangium sp. NPDC005288 TaxID=3155114 RepID=UPI0033A8E6F2